MKADALKCIPAWTLLTPDSLNRLLPAEANSLPEAIEVVAGEDAGPPELTSAPLLATTRMLIEHAATGDGLKLTATGNLSRSDVRVLFDALSWPDYDKATVLALKEVLNEADVGPVEITRLVAQEAKLLSRRQGRIRLTKLGEALAQPANELALFRLLFTLRLLEPAAGPSLCTGSSRRPSNARMSLLNFYRSKR